MTNDRLLDRAHHDLYISLVQRFRVKSTIQNFDSGDGNFGTPGAETGTQQASLFSIPSIENSHTASSAPGL